MLKLGSGSASALYSNWQNALAAAILNFSFLMSGRETDEVRHYRAQNACLIEQQAHLARFDFSLADAFSLLYSFMLIRLGTNDPERTWALTERAIELGILLRTPEEICNTSDALEFLEFVRKYALELMKK